MYIEMMSNKHYGFTRALDTKNILNLCVTKHFYPLKTLIYVGDDILYYQILIALLLE